MYKFGLYIEHKMIKSMTGFGRSEKEQDGKKISVEMKSVNHRYLDMTIKLPKKLNYYESELRNTVKKSIERGKVDIFVTYEDKADKEEVLQYNSAIAGQYLEYIRKMSIEYKLENDITTSDLIKCPDVFTMKEKEIDDDLIVELLNEVFKDAVNAFVNTREVEGENLKQDLIVKLDEMEKQVKFIKERSPIIIDEYKNKLEEKVHELLNDKQIDDNRIVMEVTLFADKICIDEEIVRLLSHIDVMRESLKNGGAVGRKLDFVAQEMNREANTMLSKSTNIEISDAAIEIKTLIEKIREQIQNIE